MIARRLILAALAAATLRGDDPAQEVWDVLAGLAGALGDGNAAAFLRACDPAMKDYQELRAAINGLIARAEVESTIDPIRNTGDDRRRSVELDWQMHVVDRADLQRTSDRRTAVQCVLEKQGKYWRLTSLAPVSFFS